MKGIVSEVESAGYQVFNILYPFLKNLKIISILSIIVHLGSIFLIFFLPFLGSHTYVSEKNLQCTVSPFISNQFADTCVDYSNDFKTMFPNRSLGSIEALNSANWIKDQLDQLGLETQLYFFNSSFNRIGVNVIGISKAIRSLGTENFVLTTSFDQWHSAGSVGFLIGFSEYLKNTTWQARDIIYVFTSEGGEINGGTSMDISGISVWLNDYYSVKPVGWTGQRYQKDNKQQQQQQQQPKTTTTASTLLRAGQIYGAIAIDRVGNKNMERILVYPEGLKGGLSNLDILNVITTTSFLNDIPAGINTHMDQEAVEGSLYGLLIFMWNSALSLPRSNHAIFTQYGINSVGVSTDHSHNVWDIDFLNTPLHKIHKNIKRFNEEPLSNTTFFNLGRIMETVIRHLHNADEQLHQSYRWYMMAGAVFFIDLGQALLPVIVFSVGIFLQLISISISIENITIRILLSLPWFLSILSFCSTILLLPWFLSAFNLIPTNDLQPANLYTSSPFLNNLFSTLSITNSIENQIIFFSFTYLFACISFYFFILSPISKYITNVLSKSFPTFNKNDWYGTQTILLLYYALLGLMGMMLNNQFTCLFIVLSLPTLHFTSFILENKVKSKVVKLIWMIICLVSHPMFLVFEWWALWSIGWKNLFIGIILASNNWGFLFFPFFIFGLVPIYLGIFKLLFISTKSSMDNSKHIDKLKSKSVKYNSNFNKFKKN
ncbi:hypothetical protein RB653_005864 [Dictyostelium firmibasis]|uniref:Uncharacterized protein n=1 Tax=Dictyostelium firmibasis TaxID=79012 RepID=A0AAN7YZN5_9MYCE